LYAERKFEIMPDLKSKIAEDVSMITVFIMVNEVSHGVFLSTNQS